MLLVEGGLAMKISIITATGGFILRNESYFSEDMVFTDFEELLAQLRYDFTGKRDAPH